MKLSRIMYAASKETRQSRDSSQTHVHKHSRILTANLLVEKIKSIPKDEVKIPILSVVHKSKQIDFGDVNYFVAERRDEQKSPQENFQGEPAIKSDPKVDAKAASIQFWILVVGPLQLNSHDSLERWQFFPPRHFNCLNDGFKLSRLHFHLDGLQVGTQLPENSNFQWPNRRLRMNILAASSDAKEL